VEKVKSNKTFLISLLALAMLIGSYSLLKNWFDQLDDDFVKYEKYEAAPSFSLELKKLVHPVALSGKKEVALADLRGQNVLMHFWATWCAPCREERPFLQELADLHADGSMPIIGVVSYETEASLINSGLLQDTPFTVVLDEEGVTALAYKVRAIPQSVLVDGEGKIRYRVKGPLNAQEIEKIQDMLATLRKEEKLRVEKSAAINP